ncbi:uncharacterized protein LOC133283527 [Gastrolobium bilobum]|uniref:uncharacterized protein LOC133283527 n=1 Tax=Gastrolobium bilobum TaxID=150636 RepID=UPI002AB29692|nr:uncharacterized protein LOC133283527 [Gastrolobium bilobum]
MAESTIPSNEQVVKVPLKVLVDKGKNKVVFAEAGKDFVDALFSFLTLPLGTIVRLIRKESNIQQVRVGSLSSLYESVEMLLQPRNSMEAYCQQLKLNIDDTEPMNYFLCEDWSCYINERGSLLSTFGNQRCHCGKIMNKVVSPENLTLGNGFVKETATFIVCDDLYVVPNVLGTSVGLLQKLGIDDMEALEEQTVDISNNEVYFLSLYIIFMVDLLKFSLFSETPLTDFILKKKQPLDNFDRGNQSQQMVVKLLVQKSNSKILFAEAEENFVDFLFSFLTFPLGVVLHMLRGFSSLSCVDKLYKSMTELSSDRYLSSQGLKDKLVKPQCAPQFKLRSSSCAGFAKGPSMYMVTDDLVVSPMSSISGVSCLRSKVPLFDLEERVITIRLNEGLSILKASLTSTSALTNGLHQFLKIIKEEN